MHARAKSGATYADIEALPPHLTGEILDGELIVSPRPAPPHSESASVIGMFLMSAYHLGLTGPGGWRIHHEPELHLGDDVLVPDLGGWRRERWPEQVGAAVEVTPDWVCEVLSPSTQRYDRIQKLRAYAHHGVQHVWLVHPTDHTVEAFERQGDRWLRHAAADGNGTFQAAPFDALAIPLRTLWLNPPDDDVALPNPNRA